MKKTIASLTILLALASCSQNQVLASLEGAVAAATVLVNTLPNIPPDVRSGVTAALVPLPAIIAETTAELSSTDSDALRAVKIAGYFRAEVAALKSLPPNVQVYTGAVLAAVEAFLAHYAPSQASNLMSMGAPDGKSTHFEPKALAKITLEAAELARKLGN